MSCRSDRRPNTYIEEAIRRAVNAHAGQTDKAGCAYILHPLRVMLAMATEAGMAVAVLHDVMEDSPVTAADLRRGGIPDEVCEAVQALTKREGEDYPAYLSRVESNALARAVKIADLRDNLRLERLRELTPTDHARLAKYHRALNRLLGAGPARDSGPADRG